MDSDGQRRPQDPQGQDRDPQLRQCASAQGDGQDSRRSSEENHRAQTGGKEGSARSEEGGGKESRLIRIPIRSKPRYGGVFAFLHRRIAAISLAVRLHKPVAQARRRSSSKAQPDDRHSRSRSPRGCPLPGCRDRRVPARARHEPWHRAMPPRG